jgi:hypothetical protein
MRCCRSVRCVVRVYSVQFWYVSAMRSKNEVTFVKFAYFARLFCHRQSFTFVGLHSNFNLNFKFIGSWNTHKLRQINFGALYIREHMNEALDLSRVLASGIVLE